MKHLLILITLIYAFTTNAQQPYNYSLTGNPVNTTNWVMTGNTSVVNDAILLVSNTNNQTGSIYYGTPEMLALCSRFTVKFKFKITNHHQNGPADGFSFFYLNNPPVGLILGGGVGIPPNPNGLLLIFDTHDNNGNNDNPLISLRNYNGTANYSENDNTGVLTPDVTSQNQITNGNWHDCEIKYNNGDLKVFLDAVQIMNTTINLNISGNFGFSSSTGAQFSNHWIKDVEIIGDVGASVNLGPDTAFCDNASYTLDATDPTTQSYLWNTGATTPTITATTGGTYYVSVTSTCGNASDTVNITFNQTPPNPIGLDTIICGGNGSPFPVPISETGLIWTKIPDGIPTTTIPIINPRSAEGYHYYIQKKNGDCASDTAEVKIAIQSPPDLTLLADQKVCESQRPLKLSANTQQNINASLKWNTGDTGCCVLAHDSGQYYVIATNYCGMDSSGCIINYEICPDFCIWAPNAFTPNGDGKNDYFEARVFCNLKKYNLTIYNRYGEMVYATSNLENRWDGNFRGKPCDVGTYFYSISANEYPANGKELSLKGDLELIR